MATNGPFGIDPEDLERALREAGTEIRDVLAKAGTYLERADQAGIGSVTSLFARLARPDTPTRPAPEGGTTGETGSGVWVIYTLDDSGQARICEVFPDELEALRAHRDNTDERRRVRFLPYGVPATVLDKP